MTWLQRYRVRHYVQNSLWIVPVCAMIAALILVRVMDWVDDAPAMARLLDWLDVALGTPISYDPDTARAFLGTMAASMFTFVVFVCSALLVAVQLASAQLTPRIIALLFREPATKLALTLFVFAFILSLASLLRITTVTPRLCSQMSAVFCVMSLAMFLVLIDRVGRFLRPSGALQAVARLGRNVLEDVYPEALIGSRAESTGPAEGLAGEPTRVISNPRDGVVLAFNIPGLVSLARRADCVIEVAPQVGDFAAAGDPLFRLYRGGDALPAEALHQLIALGQERTVEQDPAYAFRIMVDIANKGLSPAINDPTTAVLAIDQIHHLLRNVGSRHLADGRVRDAAGRLRLVYRTPDWEDFVHLAITEIRQFGGSSIQIARRLRAMLDNLIQTLPAERAALLRQELALLHRTAVRFFPEPEDRALADVSDSQGVGGSRGQNRVERANSSAEALAQPNATPLAGEGARP